MSFDKNMSKLGTRSRAESQHCFDVIIVREDGGLMIRTFTACTKWHAVELAFSVNQHVQRDRTQYEAKKRDWKDV